VAVYKFYIVIVIAIRAGIDNPRNPRPRGEGSRGGKRAHTVMKDPKRATRKRGPHAGKGGYDF